MLSICIPVYNYEVAGLVNTLNQQGKESNIPFEIILIDDCSSLKFRKANEAACGEHKYILLDKNIGRSRIRNLFLKYVKFNQLLFLDCDSVIISDGFLQNYISEIYRSEYEIIYGGLVYNYRKMPPRKFRLRWKYGINRETPLLSNRENDPYVYFKTNNFYIGKEILREIKFEERLVEYGYEDTFFAYKLMNKGLRVRHIENPVLHASEESNSEFIEKTEKSIYNLVKILNYVNNDKEFINNLRLLRFSDQISSLYLNRFVELLFIIIKPVLRLLLIRGYAGLWVLDFYKLGLFKKNSPR